MKLEKPRLKKIISVLLIGTLPLLFSGCGYPELYERVLIHGIGVDWTGREYQVTVRSSVSAEDKGEELFTCRGSTVLEALSSLSLETGREPFYSHNYLVVFGMDCARRGLDDCLDFFVRYYNTRPAVKMFLAAGTAEEVLSVQQEGKLLRMSEIEALGSGGQYNGMTVDVEILDFVNGVKGQGMSPVLPVLEATDSGARVAGTAYFEGYKIKGLLTPEQTRGFLAATGRLDKGELALEGPARATLSLRSVKSETKETAAHPPAFSITIEADADVSAAVEAQGSEGEFYANLEKEAAQKLEGEIRGALDQALLRDGCDIFGLGRQMYREQPEQWRNIRQWPDPELACEVRVVFKVRRMEQENLNGVA
ncbi:MAG: Ger(x)C family spore germination protein [Acutalibacter sp.]|nr:Ger(x)C family spore germination protein [Acutalibacter sp.]